MTTDLPGGGKSRVGGIIIDDLAIHPAGTFMYVLGSSERHPDGEVLALDLDTQTIVERIPVATSVFSLRRLAIHPDDRQLYVGSIDEDMLLVIETATHTVSATIPVGWWCGGAWRPRGGRLRHAGQPPAGEPRRGAQAERHRQAADETTDAEGCYAFPNGRADQRLELLISNPCSNPRACSGSACRRHIAKAALGGGRGLP